MATIKAYTDLEQSKKLAKILPIESADMYHFIDGIDKVYQVGFGYRKITADYYSKTKLEYIPCWSLAALFAVLPNKIVSHETAFEGEDAEGINDIYNKRIEPTEDGRYTCRYVGNGCIYESVADNPVDACCEMIIKLSELKML